MFRSFLTSVERETAAFQDFLNSSPGIETLPAPELDNVPVLSAKAR